MGFRIQNNIAAMNAQRNLGISDAGMSKSLERLSSGYRINKASDDAAGLSISQSFRADIASYKVAQRNVSEANSLIQVAEGSLDQVGNMLTRMKELATQAASANAGSNLDKIDAEYSKLKSEIDRVVNSTEYAGTSLLTGTFGASLTGTLGVNGTGDGVVGDNVVWDMTGAGVTVSAWGDNATEGSWAVDRVDATHISIGNGTVTETSAAISGTANITFAGLGVTLTNATGLTANQTAAYTFTINKTGLTDLNTASATAGTYTISDGADGTMTIGNGTITETVSDLNTGVSQTVNFSKLGISFTLGADYNVNTNLNGLKIDVASSGTGSIFQVGSKSNSYNQISFSIDSANTDDIGTSASGATAANLAATDLTTATNAQDAMKVIDKAINDVSAIRGGIGANQNRLSYAAANLSTTLENVTAADSVIRDVDMASEMTSFTKNQILVQAGTSMLAQANMASQGVLSLFG